MFQWDLVCKSDGLAELSQSLLIIGMGVGAVIFPQLADRYGRKWPYIFSMLSLTLLMFALVFVKGIIAFNVIRFAIGIAIQVRNNQD